jgi:DnaK suppressor protein
MATTETMWPEFKPYNQKKKESYMDEGQREHFYQILQSWKSYLMQEADQTIGHLKHERVRYADDVDAAAQEEEFRLELRERDRGRKLIKNIERSLDLVNKGDYGYCDECGGEIGLRRLEARPTATKCIDCKSVAEIKEKQTSI